MMRIAGLIVAGGKGLRAGGTVPKQFAIWRGKPLVRHAAEALAASCISPIIVAIPEGFENEAQKALEGVFGVRLVTGGSTRQASVRAGLEAMINDPPQAVLIHDAARPDLPRAVIERLLTGIEAHSGAIPVLPVVDSMVRSAGGLRDHAVPREDLFRVQTPQAFRFESILAAHRAWDSGLEATDDASVAEAAGLAVGLVQGDERLRKITFAADFEDANMNTITPRTGMGFDVHRLVAGEELWLCGLQIDHPLGLSGHSDADVAIHALVDALLGALAAGDIGDHFPPSDPQWKGAASHRFLAHAGALVIAAGMMIANIDVTIICEAPRIGPHKQAMRARLAEILGIQIGQVSVKATTTERLGLTGRGEGIAAQAVATLIAAAG